LQQVERADVEIRRGDVYGVDGVAAEEIIEDISERVCAIVDDVR
jgi:hypothetical protein